MGESAKAMIERFRHQKPLSREQRQQLNASKGVKEMWWITESGGDGSFQHQQGTEDIELPRPSPMKPHLCPPTKSSLQNLHPPDFGTSGNSVGGVRDSDDAFLTRLGLGRSSGDRGRTRDSRDGRGEASAEFFQSKYSRDFGREGESGVKQKHQPSIDDMISADVAFSNSIERLLNAYPKHPTSAGASFDNQRRSGGEGLGGYRLRSSLASRGSADRTFSSSLDLQEGGTLKGLLLSLKLDGRSSAVPDKDAGGPRDQKEMSENLQAIIDSLHCLDEATEEGGGKGPSAMAENIQQVCTNLHAEMSTFAALYGEKYANEDRALEERKLRDEQMRLEGKREQLKDLQRDHCRTLGREEEQQLQPEELDRDPAGSEETKTSFPAHHSSPLFAATHTSAATALTESRLRAAWVGTEGRPVWSPQLGKYVLPPDPAVAAEQKKEQYAQEEEEKLRVPPPSFRPLFSSSGALLPPAPTPPMLCSPSYSSGLSHGSISRAARAVIETCLNATEQTLSIRLPEDIEEMLVEPATILEEAFLSNQSKATNRPETEGQEEEARKKNPEQLDSDEETKKEESILETTTITAAVATAIPYSNVAATSTKEKLEKIEALLGHEDEASLRFLAAYTEQKRKSESLPSSVSAREKTSAVKFRSLEEIDEALSSKPSLPPAPVYKHDFFERHPATSTSSANLSIADHSSPTDREGVRTFHPGGSSRHSSRAPPPGGSWRGGALPNFLLHKAYPEEHHHYHNLDTHQRNNSSSLHLSSDPRPSSGRVKAYTSEVQISPRRLEHHMQEHHSQGGNGGGAKEIPLRKPPHDIHNNNNNNEMVINTKQNNIQNLSHADVAARGKSFSNFHERALFLEQMKRLRFQMTH